MKYLRLTGSSTFKYNVNERGKLQMQQVANQLEASEMTQRIGKHEAEWRLKEGSLQRKQQMELEVLLHRGARRRDEMEMRKMDEIHINECRWRNATAVRPIFGSIYRCIKLVWTCCCTLMLILDLVPSAGKLAAKPTNVWCKSLKQGYLSG